MTPITSASSLHGWRSWFTPRSSDPTIAYRERALRILLPAFVALRILGTVGRYFDASNGPGTFVPWPVYIVLFLIPILLSIYFLVRQNVDRAGIWFLLHWYLIDLLSLPVEGYWYSGYQISLIVQMVLGTLLLPTRLILPFMVFQLATVTLWGNWLDDHYYDPPLLSSGQPVAGFWTTMLTLAVQETLIVLILRYLRREMEKSLTLQQITIRQLHAESMERQNMERALKDSEAHHRLLLEHLPVVAYMTAVGMEPHNPTLYISPQILKLSNHTNLEFLQDPQLWTILIHPEDMERVVETSVRSDQSMQGFTVDYRILDAEGRTLWIHDENVLVKDDTGKALYRLGVWTDITELKQAEAVQEKLIGDLEQRNAELERLAYTLSHELKSPLITIQGFMGYLREDAIQGNIPRLEQDIQRISEGTGKMARLINELIRLMMVGRIAHEPRQVSLQAIAVEAASLLEEKFIERQISVHIADDLPQVHGDYKQLLEVFQNLLENAMKFMGDQARPQIEIGVRHEKDTPVFYVRDNGIGIEARFSERIFGIFQKLDAQSEGTGIGLALVRRMIEMHGGKIWVESGGSRKGSTFCFTLPHTSAGAQQ